MDQMPSSAAAWSRPDPQAARLVLASCAAMADREGELAERFRTHLGAAGAPHAQSHAEELLHSILAAVNSTADPEAIERRWRELGARAELGGYADDGFGRIGQALLRAVRDVAGDDWSSLLSSSWMAFHLWMAGHLAVGAAKAQAAVPLPPSAGPAGPGGPRGGSRGRPQGGSPGGPAATA